jgi:TolB protein
MNVDGSEQVRLTETTDEGWHNWWPTWSPDGERIAFVSRRQGGNVDIYVMNADGSNLVRLTYHDAADAQPSWSPDGAFIAFTSKRVGKDALYMVRADGKSLAPVTYGVREEVTPSWGP